MSLARPPGAAPRVLVVDDERRMREVLEMGLAQNGFEVMSASDGPAALALMRQWVPDIIVLDVMMPKIDGLTLLPMLRRMTEAPIVLLTARIDDETKVDGLTGGADDYIAKPFELRELVARLHTRLRRPQLARPEYLEFADLAIDLKTRTAFRAGEAVELSTREFDLLLVLLREPGRVFSRDQLIDLAWGSDATVAPNAVEVYISYLRAKLERPALRKLIHTIRRAGYSLRQGDG